MKRKFTVSQKKAIRDYYQQRKNNFHLKTKQDCLICITVSIKKSRNIKYFQACAGTFWFTWADGVTTQHNEKIGGE